MHIRENYVVVDASTTPISSVVNGVLNNHVSVGGTVTDPYGDDS